MSAAAVGPSWSTSLRAELGRSARSRPLASVLVASVLVTVLVGYVAVHGLLAVVGDADPSAGVADRLRDLSPSHLRVGMASVVTGGLPVLALLSGGLVVRADYRGGLLDRASPLSAPR